MKVLGIAGSPRRAGNTQLLLRKALEGAGKPGVAAEPLFISELKISPCRECGGCGRTGKCVVDDDMRSVYPMLQNADRVIIASPIFFGGVTANLKAMIDRCQCLWVRKYILKLPVTEVLNRKGAFISACGGKNAVFFPAAALTIKTLFTTIDVSYASELFFPGMDGITAAAGDPCALEKAFEAGRLIAGA